MDALPTGGQGSPEATALNSALSLQGVTSEDFDATTQTQFLNELTTLFGASSATINSVA
jgi:hypothetical protein